MAELAVAVLLLPAATAAAGAAGALALLLVFTAAVAAGLARGVAPECHCFGQLHSEPASPRTLARNGVLMGLAAFALAGTLAGDELSAVAWIGRLDAIGIVALAAGIAIAGLIAAGSIAFFALLRSYGRLLVRLDRLEQRLADAGFDLDTDEREPRPTIGLEPGTPAPAFAVADTNGDSVTLDDLLAPELPLLLLFTSTRCGPCQALLPQAATWQRELADRLTIAFANDGSPEDVRAEAGEHGLEHVVVDEGAKLYKQFEASGTPGAVLVEADGTIASWVATGPDWIEDLVEEAVAEPAHAGGLPVGSPVPAIELESLDGDRIGLADLRGADTLLLFWNPDCGFCRQMHDQLLAWEATSNGVTPRLVVVSSGDPERTRADRFRSTVLLDAEYAVSDAFGAGGTPMAVLLTADGHVGSRVAAGAEAVFSIANGR
jgi:peroxiredoxin